MQVCQTCWTKKGAKWSCREAPARGAYGESWNVIYEQQVSDKVGKGPKAIGFGQVEVIKFSSKLVWIWRNITVGLNNNQLPLHIHDEKTCSHYWTWFDVWTHHYKFLESPARSGGFRFTKNASLLVQRSIQTINKAKRLCKKSTGVFA